MKKYKIGRYTYEEIAMDKFGEPKILRDWEDEEIFTLVDYDGDPVKFFRRIKGNKYFGVKVTKQGNLLFAKSKSRYILNKNKLKAIKEFRKDEQSR